MFVHVCNTFKQSAKHANFPAKFCVKPFLHAGIPPLLRSSHHLYFDDYTSVPVIGYSNRIHSLTNQNDGNGQWEKTYHQGAKQCTET